MLHSHPDLETSIRQFDKSQTETAVRPGKVGVGISPEALRSEHRQMAGNYLHGCPLSRQPS